MDGISLTRTEDLRTDVSIALGVKDAVPQPVLLFEIDERRPDAVPQEYDVHGNPVGRWTSKDPNAERILGFTL